MKKLLYVEDDEALAHVTKRALATRGFDVHHVSALFDVPKLLESYTFTHALLDLKIGQDHSLPLISEIKRYGDIPIVVLTGYGTVRTAVQAIKLGAVNFISKPSGIEEIVGALVENEIFDIVEEEVEDLRKPSLKALEHEAIQRALDENDGNISAAARQLKMHRRTLQRKLSKRHTDPST